MKFHTPKQLKNPRSKLFWKNLQLLIFFFHPRIAGIRKILSSQHSSKHALNQSQLQIKHQKNQKIKKKVKKISDFSVNAPGRDRRKIRSKESDGWHRNPTESKARKARFRYDARPKPPLHPSLQISGNSNTNKLQMQIFRVLRLPPVRFRSWNFSDDIDLFFPLFFSYRSGENGNLKTVEFWIFSSLCVSGRRECARNMEIR